MMDFKRNDNERSAGADPDVTALLRAVYAAPADEGYWQGLEQRVMSRLNESPVVAWWSVLLRVANRRRDRGDIGAAARGRHPDARCAHFAAPVRSRPGGDRVRPSGG